MHRVVFLFFFLSGFSSLVFEIIWARMLQQVFGTTSFAISTLLTAFMAGLALGSFVGGRLASRVNDQLRLYAILEACIGAYALIVPILLGQLPGLYGLLFEHFIEDFYLFSLLRFAAVFLILVIPTTLMGATLPLVSQWIADRQRLFQGSIGVLYGANTLGACLGCFSAGFLLLPTLGLSLTNTLFASLNFALCALILICARRLLRPQKSEPSIDLDDRDMRHVLGGTARAQPHPPWAVTLALVAFGITGAVAMSYQVLWTRAYLITLGSSTYSFTLVLTTVLVAIALGSAAISPLIKRVGRPLFWLALLQFGVASTATLSFFILNRIPIWLFERIRAPLTHIGELYLFQFGLVALVVFVPSLLQGASFPMVIRAVTGRNEDTGGDVGNAYAYNTTGAIIGSFSAGFILLPWLGLQQAIAAVIAINIALAIAVGATELSLQRRHMSKLGLAAALIATAALYWLAPPLDRAQLTSGVFRAHTSINIFHEHTFQDYDPEILFYEDGLTSTTSVERHGERLVLKANGKPEASDGADMPTQVLVGLLPFIIRSGWDDIEAGDENAAMIGFGSGVTAGASLQWPLESLAVVEIESTMIDASRHFQHVNNRPLDDPRLHIVESDGRNFVEYTPERFDVIISEPSNPWIAGVSALFTVEYFERARTRLNPNGIYAQWVQLYEMRPENVRTVFETFHRVFPHVHAFSSRPKSTDLILIGSERPLAFPAAGYRDAWQIETVRDELQRVSITSAHHLLALLFMNHEQLASFAQGAVLNTDDNGHLEFSAPRDVIFHRSGEDFFTDWYFNVDDYGDPRPYLDDWPHPTSWTPERVAALTEALWLAGKPSLTAHALRDSPHGDDPYHSFSALPEPMQPVGRVLQASQVPLDQALQDHWPTEGDERLQNLLHILTEGGDPNHYLRELITSAPPTGDGYDGIRGLYHAALLTTQRDYRAAEEQLDHLSNQSTESLGPAYHILRAHVLHIRRRYDASYDAYLAYSQATTPNQ